MLQSISLLGIAIICALPSFKTAIEFSTPLVIEKDPDPVQVLLIPDKVKPVATQFAQSSGFLNAVNDPAIAGTPLSQTGIASTVSSSSFASVSNCPKVFASASSVSNVQTSTTDTGSKGNLLAFITKSDTNSNSQSFIPNSAPYSGNTASTSSATVLSPSMEAFSNSIFQDVLSVPSLQKFLHILIPGHELRNVFYKLDHEVLSDYWNPEPAALAQVVAQAIGSHDVWSLPFYFKAVGNTLAKFLFSEGVLIPETLLSISRSYANFIEKALEVNNVNNIEALFQALLDGFINFFNSQGYSFLNISTQIFSLFAKEVIALENCI